MSVSPSPSPPPDPLPYSFPWEGLADVGRFLFVMATGFVVCIIVLIPIGWWSSVSDAIRSVLEALPLGDAVATQPFEHGMPILVGFLTALLVAGAIYGVTRWRIRSLRAYIYGGNTLVQPFTVSMIRTVAIFGGLTLIPVVAVVAGGKDLRDEPEYTFTGPLWPILIIGCWLVYSWVGMAKVHNRGVGPG